MGEERSGEGHRGKGMQHGLWNVVLSFDLHGLVVAAIPRVRVRCIYVEGCSKAKVDIHLAFCLCLHNARM
jgi:hypothetical protein